MIQDWMLERYQLGELPAAEKAEVERALAADDTVRVRLDALKADSQQVLALRAPSAVAAEVERRAKVAAEPKPSAPMWRPMLAVAFAVAFAVVATVLLRPPPTDDTLTSKGVGPSLRLFRQTRSGAPERLYNGAHVHAHDRVQVSFDLAGQRSLVVVSIDGGGHATLHFPTDGIPVAAPGLKALPESFELDDAPGYERFFLVSSNQPLNVDAVVQAAQALAARSDAHDAALLLPEGSTQRSLTLDKEPR
jgi:hypothetical protein